MKQMKPAECADYKYQKKTIIDYLSSDKNSEDLRALRIKICIKPCDIRDYCLKEINKIISGV